jgi:8-oxo-dGTP diphosphatase
MTIVIPSDPLKKVYFISCAILENEKQEIFIQRRPGDKYHANLWEFPGGKIEPFETPDKALIREIDEEINLIVENPEPLYFTSKEYDEYHVVLLAYVCHKWKGEIQLKEDQPEYKWVHIDHLLDYPMPLANQDIILYLKAKEANYSINKR